MHLSVRHFQRRFSVVPFRIPLLFLALSGPHCNSANFCAQRPDFLARSGSFINGLSCGFFLILTEVSAVGIE